MPIRESALRLVRRHWFTVGVVLLLSYSLANFSGRAILSALMKVEAVHRLIRGRNDLRADGSRWRRWLAENPGLFESLKVGAGIGVVRSLSDGAGAIWNRRPEGMAFALSADVRAEEPGVILSLSDGAVHALVGASDAPANAAGLSGQEALRQQLRAGEARAFYLRDVEALKEMGYPKFLRAIDAWRGGPPFEADEDVPREGYRLLVPEGWRVTASHSAEGVSASAVLDGTTETSWQSGASMNAQMFLEVDFGRQLTVSGVELLNSWENRQDYPRGLDVRASGDGKGWAALAQGEWRGDGAPDDGDVWVGFQPVQARFLRLRQTAWSEAERPIPWWWSVGELRVFGPKTWP